VRAFDLLRQHLGIGRIHTLIGGSLGGQQVLEWAIEQPGVFEHIVAIACNARHSPWGIAFNEAQRMAIEADATWRTCDERAGIEGMKAARAMGMISFRTYETYQRTQLERTNETIDNFRAASYQRYQGEKLANRFNAFSYWTLTRMMDCHNVGRGREGITQALRLIQARALVIGIDSDLFYPLQEQQLLATSIPNARLEVINSVYGHDGFLVEFDVMKTALQNFYNKEQVELSIQKQL
jgi:homoserine O-acetyltransferase/O-succinyltransferase